MLLYYLTNFVLNFCSTDHVNCRLQSIFALHITFPAAAWRPLWQHAGEGVVGGGGALHWGGGRAVCLERETKEVGGETKGRRSPGGQVNTSSIHQSSAQVQSFQMGERRKGRAWKHLLGET